MVWYPGNVGDVGEGCFLVECQGEQGKTPQGCMAGNLLAFTVSDLLYNGIGVFLQVQRQKEGGWQGSIRYWKPHHPKCTTRVGKKESGSMTEVVGPGHPSFFFVRKAQLA